MGVLYSKLVQGRPTYIDIQYTRPASLTLAELHRGIIVYPSGSTYYYEDAKSDGLEDKLFACRLISNNDPSIVDDLLQRLQGVSYDSTPISANDGTYVYSAYYPGRVYNGRTKFTDSDLVARVNHLVFERDSTWYAKMGFET